MVVYLKPEAGDQVVLFMQNLCKILLYLQSKTGAKSI